MEKKGLKKTIFDVVERTHSHSKASLIFEYFMIVLITLNVIVVILESYSEIKREYNEALQIFDLISIIIFSLEYIARIWTADLLYPDINNSLRARLKFMFSFNAVIDLLSVLPFYLPLIMETDMRMIRILRVFRMLRTLKLNRYSRPLTIIKDILFEKKQELLATLFLSFLLILIASTFMYHIENEANPEHFPNIVESFWWTVVTITTVGYGDIVPKTGLGKVVAGITAFLGLMVVAIPSGIISSGFLDKLQRERKAKEARFFKDKIFCPHCGEKLPEEYWAEHHGKYGKEVKKSSDEENKTE
jgi:voltage-gated potassium channel